MEAFTTGGDIPANPPGLGQSPPAIKTSFESERSEFVQLGDVVARVLADLVNARDKKDDRAS